MRPEAEASGYLFVRARRQGQRPREFVVEKGRAVWAGGDPRGPSATPQDDTPSKEGGKCKSKSKCKCKGKSKSNSKCKCKCKSKCKCKCKCKSKSKSKCKCKSKSKSNSKGNRLVVRPAGCTPAFGRVEFELWRAYETRG
jgi:hypothetical protein